MKGISTTNKVFFDTDCLSTFIKIGRENLIISLYSKIYLPSEVYEELKLYQTRIFGKNIIDIIDKLIESGSVEKIHIYSEEEIYMYYDLKNNGTENYKIIGKGEASVITLAYYRKGIVASNNLSDISHYIEKYNLQGVTTSSIIKELVDKEILDEKEAEKVWKELVTYDNKINPFKMPYFTYKEYVKSLIQT